MDKLILIGAGQIGSRHLQSLSKIDREAQIYVFDKNLIALERARERYEQIPQSNLIKSIDYSIDINEFAGDADVAVVATNADVRLEVIETLLHRVQVRYLILEKVVCQSVEDLRRLSELLRKNQTKAWVNFSRRMMPFFRDIKKNIEENEKVYIYLEEGDLGLIQSSIHYLDLLLYFSDEKELLLDGSGVDSHVQRSKRDGYVELTGVLRGRTERGSELTVVDYRGSKASDVIHIFGGSSRYMFSETLRKAYRAQAENNWEWIEQSFSIPFQSDLTHRAIEQILDTSECDLPTLEESLCVHETLLNLICLHLEKDTGCQHSKIPIT